MGYRFQFVTLAGFHSVCNSMFDLARGYAAEGMSAYVRLQQHEFANEEFGYTATRHQREVGAGYFDAVLEAVSGGESSTLALKGSTEEAQFEVAPCRLSAIATRSRHRSRRGGRPHARGARPRRRARARVRRPARGAPPRARRAPGADRGRRAPRLPRVDALDPRRRLARRTGSGRPPGPARRDHRPGRRPEDGHQRLQLGRPHLHGRLRGRELADVGERRRRSAEPHGRDRADDLARAGREALCAERRGRGAPRPSAWLAPAGAPRRGRRQARLRRALRLRRLLPAQRASACWSAARGRTSTSRSSRATSRRGSGTTSSASRRTALGIPRGTIKATVLIETILAAFEMEEILYELREHSAGLNAGRWDYIFSVIKKFRDRPEFVLPDRAQVTMTVPFMRAYTELLVQHVPPPWRARDRRHGRVHPEPARSRGQRDRARARHARTRRASPATASTGRGSRTRISCPSRWRSSTPFSASGRTSSTGSATTSRRGRRTC